MKQPQRLKIKGINFNPGASRCASQKILFDNQIVVALDQKPEPGDKIISLNKKPEKILKTERIKRGTYIIMGAS